jgi:pimeloyl-ACP methyl ester carboxylesterase
MKRLWRLLVGLALLGGLLWDHPHPVAGASEASSADVPTDAGGIPDPTFDPDQARPAATGVVSNALACLGAGKGATAPASGTVRLVWGRQSLSGARLVLTVSGSQAAHTIRVNGQPVARAPIHPGGQPCGTPPDGGEAFYLDIPPEVVVNGENQIEITSDADPHDYWTAANVRLEVLGDPALPGADDEPPEGVAGTAAQAQVFTFSFTNLYDDSSQEAIGQIPSGYDPNVPTPLVVFCHARSSVMESGIDVLGDAANAQGWLLASPQMHGSWTGDPQPDPPGKQAYASLESQYDIAGTVRYMVERYNVKHDQIYLVGYSMGGQIATVTGAKFPHVFAAVFDNKGATDMMVWYDEQGRESQRWMERECHIDGVRKTPAQNPFCYQRRSSLNFARNYTHIPISITHSLSDTMVPPHHSSDLYTRIKSFYPDHPVAVYWDRTQGPTCPPYYHCLEPDPGAVLDFLGAYTRPDNPARVQITSDQAKSYYWLDLAPADSESWVHVLQAAYDRPNARFTAVVSTTSPVEVGLNLGATPIVGPAGIPQPGMGLPPGSYRVEVNGQGYTEDYAFGYLTVSLPAAGQYSLSLAAPSLCDTAGLIRALKRANGAGRPVTLRLGRGCTYALSEVDNRADGANGLPSIRGEITIEGDGATIERGRAAGVPDLRLFHVASGGSLTLQEVTLGNGAATYGGAIYSRGGAVKLIDSTLAGNSATYGGAIYACRGTVELASSTVRDNSAATRGGGLDNDCGTALALTNSTVSGNQSGDRGGGISNREGSLAAIGSTISGNDAGSGGGIHLARSATMTLRNTIVARNPSGGDCEIVRTSGASSGGYNLDGDGTCDLDPALGDLRNVDPMLGPLMHFGGATATHPLGIGSPALDRIPPGSGGCGDPPLDVDQRGQRRPADGNGDGPAACDVGAFERQAGETPIGLLSLTAEARVASVRLDWQTGIEVDGRGFDVWRSPSEDGPYGRINAQRIPARGGPASGAHYSYLDDGVTGDAYYYKLEAVNAKGRSIFYGPVLARLGWVQRGYLPVMLKR